MAGDFLARIAALKEEVGDRDLDGKCKVDQHYALHQHETFGYAHVRGGGPKYLEGPFFANSGMYIGTLADAVLGGSLIAAMAENMEHLSSELDPAAPIDEDPNLIRLRRSGNPIVIDDGIEVYNRPPIDPREPMGAGDRDPRPGTPGNAP